VATDRQSATATAEVPTDIVKRSSFQDEELRTLDSFDAALALVAEEFGTVESVDEEIGDGFSLVDDKSELIGLPMILMEWTFNDGEFGGQFVSVRAVAKLKNGQPWKVIFNDGSTGILAQLQEYTSRKGRNGGLVVKRGLRVSNYEYDDGTGPKPAKTFYLDTSS